ncbi:MAG: NAD-dependent epimerase/dehydratase family protein [Planctomycetes bacterium]|jgi:nucleoside-diphosphate-sugar epimerase|nr:NAD-dependent epimerase/dehydratase family protein [Planctomycetota bacterium]
MQPKTILVTGALGQIGAELVPELRLRYGAANVVATDIRPDVPAALREGGPFRALDVTDLKALGALVREFRIGTIYHLAALLSAVGEANPKRAWDLNMGGLVNVLELARETGAAVFHPSSIGAFGPDTPKKRTPQVTIQRPTSMYGVTKVAGELLCDYYARKFGVDARGVRFPGIISNVAPPGGGTTDYAVEIYYEAVRRKAYTCPLRAGTFLDMMYMPDALHAAIGLMEADPGRLRHRNAYNVSAMSFDPEMIAAEIRRHVAGFTMDYRVEPVKQAIADSWPDAMDDSAAREDWDWKPGYDLARMTADMLRVLGVR